MKRIKVFIDGRAGTTGLQIEQRLAALAQVELLVLPESERRSAKARRDRLNEADAVFLCLPDDAAREAVGFVTNGHTVILDASTAHRTAPGWAYGFPELGDGYREALRESRRIAVPGCHASGYVALARPLVQAGLLPPDTQLGCTSLTGYSGGGKAMIAEYEGENPPRGARPYALGLSHKHLPEMQRHSGLTQPPIFMPVLAPVRQGMLVTLPLALDAARVHACYTAHYRTPGAVRVMPAGGGDCLEAGRLDMEAANGTNDMELFVFGHETQSLAVARFDNLGKGASGAAVQCFRLRFGLDG